MSTKLKLLRELRSYLNDAVNKGVFISLIKPTLRYNCLTNLNFTKTKKKS